VVKRLLEWLIGDGWWPDHPYNPEDHGYIALVEPDDVDLELEDIDMPDIPDEELADAVNAQARLMACIFSWQLPSPSLRSPHGLVCPYTCR
jgi:hypothetical protein